MENTRTITKEVKKGQRPTKKQIIEIQKAQKKTVVFDDDAPELTIQQYKEMAKIAREKRSKKTKVVIAIRISPDTLKKAKATGKGYTGFLSRLLDNAINDSVLVSKSLE